MMCAILWSATADAWGSIDQCQQWNESYNCRDSDPCTIIFHIGYCFSCDNSTCGLTVGTCFIDFDVGKPDYTTGYYTVEAYSCQQLNDEICGVINREGPLCSKCMSGYGPSLYSSTVQCEECHHDNSIWLWLIYVVLEIAPPTIFYLLVILFNVSTTSPPFTAVVFFSQFFGLIYRTNAYFKLELKLNANKTFLKSVLTLIDVWNLDFFRHSVPPFCVSSHLTDLDAVFLEYVSALYPLLLIIVTYVSIELHARNCRLLVIFWKPFHRCFAKCRRRLDPKSSLITGFATFISLSASKVLFTTCIIILPGFSRDEYTGKIYKSLYDSRIQGNSTSEFLQSMASMSYFVPLVVIIALVHLPVFLLVLYPIKFFRKLLTYCGRSQYRTILVFVDTFQGYYKDGTTGTFDYRAASSISFLLRLFLCEHLYNYPSRIGLPFPSSFSILVFLLLLASLFYSLVQPCKKRYMNVMESVLYFIAAMILMGLSFGSNNSGRQKVRSCIALVFIALPSWLVLLALMSSVGKCLCSRSWQILARVCLKLCEKCGFIDSSEADLEVPDRLQNPLDYEPLP